MKRLVFFLTLVALVFSGCRKEADYHPYIGETGDLAYDSYSSQFDYLWKCMSTGYVFWDVDETDWDAVYVEYMPKFKANTVATSPLRISPTSSFATSTLPAWARQKR